MKHNSDGLRDPNIFYDLLYRQGASSAINGKLVRMLKELDPSLAPEVCIILHIYFSFIDDGNTRASLNAETLLHKWMSKWRMLSFSESDIQSHHALSSEASAEQFFSNIFKKGTEAFESIIQTRESPTFNVQIAGTEPAENAFSKPLTIVKDTSGNWLYTSKLYKDKRIIEEACASIFKIAEIPDLSSKCASFMREFSNIYPIHSKNGEFRPTAMQAESIVRGLESNLIITGGPGTGKTTVICFLLWHLLYDHPEYLSWDIKLAAPSGKAADRMRESLLESLQEFDCARMNALQKKIYEKLHSLESYTLHRMLNYRPQTNQFSYNKEHPFPQKTIFVLDEASMIDIYMFGRFMVSFPRNADDNGNMARLYILGDANQLPSVEAGAVLGEMLSSDKPYIAELQESQRFDDNTPVGRLAKSIKQAHISKCFDLSPEWSEAPSIDFCENIPGAVSYINITNTIKDQKKEIRQIKLLISHWCSQFYIKNEYIQKALQIDPLLPPEKQQSDLEALWKLGESARILSAERTGIRGTGALNKMIREALARQLDRLDSQLAKQSAASNERFYAGQLLMLTQNQTMLKLYNGDTGIVIPEQKTGRLHLLLKKVQTRQTQANDACNYVFYPLYTLPNDALESSFAMTIHKSQGSGYKHIMMFLPHSTSPLLNNQIVYTGVTRTKGGSLTIVSDPSSFKNACELSIERDTGLNI